MSPSAARLAAETLECRTAPLLGDSTTGNNSRKTVLWQVAAEGVKAKITIQEKQLHYELRIKRVGNSLLHTAYTQHGSSARQSAAE